jgi:hypothetical protein
MKHTPLGEATAVLGDLNAKSSGRRIKPTVNDYEVMMAVCECGNEFTPRRTWQQHCSRKCSNRVAQRRRRDSKCADTLRSPAVSAFNDPESSLTGTRPAATSSFNPRGPTPGVLQGDDYPLEYYEDGYPKLPTCLDKRVVTTCEVAA